MIHVNIIGVPHVLIDGKPVQFPYKKAEGAFYYLCMNKTTSRQALIQTLWEECDEAAGRKSLREAIYRMKKIFGNDFILTNGNATISINPDIPLSIDSEHLTADQLAEQGGQGIFAHFYVKNCYEFQDWVTQLQEIHNRGYLRCVASRVHNASLATDEDLHRYQDALLRFDPYNETEYCQVMELLIKQHKWVWTVSFYHDLEQSLSKELGIAPSPHAQRLWAEGVRRSKRDESTQNLPFLSRREELSTIQSRISGWQAGQPGANLAIAGETGVGKTQLLDYARSFAQQNDLPLLSVSAFPNEIKFPFKILFDLFRTIGRTVSQPQQLPPSYHRLNSILSGDVLLEGGQNQDITHETISHLLLDLMEQYTAHSPTVLIVDDLQWVDELSAALLCRLLRDNGAKILLIVSYDSSDQDRVLSNFSTLFHQGSIQVLPLSPLSREETQDYVLSLLPDTSAEHIEQIFQHSDGNPRYLSELVTYFHDHDDLRGVPPRISVLLHHRLSSLSREVNQLLNSLSIFSHPASARELGYLIDWSHDQILTLLEDLTHKSLVQEVVVGHEIFYRPRHHFLSEYLYQRQSESRRQLQHTKLAQTYEQMGGNPMTNLPLVIYHYERSGNRHAYFRHRITYLKQFHSIAYENFPLLRRDVSWNETLPSPEGGAKELLSLAQEVLDWQENTPAVETLKMEMHYILGRHQISTGQYQNGLHHIQACQQLAERFGDTITQTLCCKQRIFYGIQTQNTQLMEENLTAGFALLNPQEEPDQQATFLRLQGVLHLLKADYETAQQALSQSLDLFRSLESPSRRYSINIAACLAYQGDIAIAQGNYSDALSYYQNAIDTNSEAVITNGLGLFWVQVCYLYLLMEQYDNAAYAQSQAEQCFRHYDSAWGRDKLEILSSYLAFQRRDYQSAERHYRRAVALEELIQNPSNWTLIHQMEDRLTHKS